MGLFNSSKIIPNPNNQGNNLKKKDFQKDLDDATAQLDAEQERMDKLVALKKKIIYTEEMYIEVNSNVTKSKDAYSVGYVSETATKQAKNFDDVIENINKILKELEKALNDVELKIKKSKSAINELNNRVQYIKNVITKLGRGV